MIGSSDWVPSTVEEFRNAAGAPGDVALVNEIFGSKGRKRIIWAMYGCRTLTVGQLSAMTGGSDALQDDLRLLVGAGFIRTPDWLCRELPSSAQLTYDFDRDHEAVDTWTRYACTGFGL